MSEHVSQTIQLDHAWAEQSPVFQEIYEVGIQAYVDTHPDGLILASTSDDRILRCIDEGTPGGVHMAGSGILHPPEYIVELLKRANLAGITSHEQCGAAAIAASTRGVEPYEIEEFSRHFAEQLAERVGVPYMGHIPIRQMARPSGIHVARIAYLTTTPFDPTLAHLPAGFVINQGLWGNNKQASLQEVEIAASIAMSDHGYGKRITEQNPFVVCSIGNPESITSLQREFSQSSLLRQFGHRIKIDGFQPR